MNTTLNEAPHRWLDLGHSRLPYWRIGQGPDLVFVHGWPLDARTWRDIVPALSDRFTCHVIDLPGAGQSEWGEETPRDLRGMAGSLIEAIDAMELKRFGLVGHDSGGTFARMAAAHFNDRLTGVALGNTEIPGHHPWRLKLMFAAGRAPGSKKMFPAALKSRAGRWLLMRDAVYDRSLIESTFSPLFLIPLAEDPKKLLGAMGMATATSVEDFDMVGEDHPKITAPVHLIWGENDPWFPLKKCRAMATTFGGETTLKVVPRARLLVHEEAPQVFAQEVAQHFS